VSEERQSRRKIGRQKDGKERGRKRSREEWRKLRGMKNDRTDLERETVK
jgi:hypothetical protein